MTDWRRTFDELTLDALYERRGAKWRKYDTSVVPVWVADMDFPISPAVGAVLEHHRRQGDLGYASYDDDHGYRMALSTWLQARDGWAPHPDDIHTVVDVLQGMAATVAVHTRPGDGIILQTPAYPPLFRIIEEADRRLIANPLTADHRLDVEHLAEVAPDARALLLCNPHNPTGRVFTADELGAALEVASRHDLLIISDEIHADLVHHGHRHIPMASLDAAHSRTVTLTSASKTFAMPGLSCAAAIGPPAMLDPIRSMPMGLLGHPSVVGLRAAVAAWEDDSGWLDEVRRRIVDNLRHAAARLEEGGFGTTVPEATYLMWVDCRPKDWNDEPAERFVRDAKVAFGFGSDFGVDSVDFVRLNVATVRSVLDEALDRALSLG
ncbi:MAG: aminotransferase class I/II-fold pyridoxal phosphate-dependent enzyme [Acidimicrobiia bacterium]|nr:aminotransferase class I/II-fold pyridoxal phosphate-dependent enzyme [Acidimicrobiia bacterium]